MSIVNDALKKVEHQRALNQDRPSLVLHKIDQLRTDGQRYMLRKRLIWTGTGVACLVGLLLAFNSVRIPKGDFSASEAELFSPTLPQPLLSLEAIKEAEQAKEKAAGFQLSGIVYDAQNPLAIINGKIIGEGAYINDAQLLEIMPNYVVLSLAGKEQTIRIK